MILSSYVQVDGNLALARLIELPIENDAECSFRLKLVLFKNFGVP